MSVTIGQTVADQFEGRDILPSPQQAMVTDQVHGDMSLAESKTITCPRPRPLSCTMEHVENGNGHAEATGQARAECVRPYYAPTTPHGIRQVNALVRAIDKRFVGIICCGYGLALISDSHYLT